MLKKLSLLNIILLIGLLLFVQSCQIIITPTDNKKIIEEVQATCTKEGYIIYEENGIRYKDKYQALGHDYSDEIIDEKYYKYTCVRCNNSYQIEINHVHEFDEMDNYIIIQKCHNCEYEGRIEPTYSFLEKFKYFYTDEYDAKYQNLVTDTENLIKEAESSKNLSALCDKVIDKIDDLNDLYDEIIPCYYFSEVQYYQSDNEEYEENYDKMLEKLNDIEAKLYNLEYQIFNSKLKEIYFEGEDLEAIEKELAKYADDTISKLNTEITQLGDQAYYDDLDNTTTFKKDVQELIKKRSELAALYGYDNFYEYSYAEEYGRKYSTKDVQTYRDYVLNRIVPLYNTLVNKLSTASQSAFDEFNDFYYYACWDNKDVILTVSNYFKSINSAKYKLDMYETVNDAIKIGAVFIGEESGIEAAYTNCSGFDQNICYFANIDYYSAALTYVHEFGHFMIPEEYLNSVDYDLAETHSQSNEALYVRYLINNNIIKTKETFELIFVVSNLETIISTCMTDEFEESLYKNYSSLDTKFTDGIDYTEYSSLVKAIEKKYDFEDGLSNWDYYFCTSSCYEISYGISLVPCLGLFADSKTNYDQAKESYIKILRYYDMDGYKEEDSYTDVLTRCGYYTPFEESLYDLLDNTYGKQTKSTK